MSKKKRINSKVIGAYVRSRLGFRGDIRLYEAVCLALEADGMPCPMDIELNSWVRSHLDFIYDEAKKAFPYQYEQCFPPTGIAKEKVQQIGEKQNKTIFNQEKSFIISNNFLFSYKWRKLRMEALIQYGRKCMCCGATPEAGAVMNVDHIKPRKRYPELALKINNLQILCHECNHGKGNWNETDWRNK